MNKKAAIVLLSALLFACAPVPSPPAAPPPPAAPAAAVPPASAPPLEHRIVTIRSVNCAALLGLAEEDRASASMFYLGYTASRRGRRSIDVADIDGLEAAALGYCEAHPEATAAGAFNQAFAENRR